MFSHIIDIFREDEYVRDGVCIEISNISLHLPLGIILSYAIIFVHGTPNPSPTETEISTPCIFTKISSPFTCISQQLFQE